MKKLVVISLLLLGAALFMGCSSGSGGSGGGGASSAPTIAPSPSPNPSPSPSASPTPSPTPGCAAVLATRWVVDNVTYTDESSDQGNIPYITEMDFSSGTSFVMQQIINGITKFCNRDLQNAQGDLDNLTWTSNPGDCSSLSNWIQIDTSTCSSLTVIIRDGIGNIYETIKYNAVQL